MPKPGQCVRIPLAISQSLSRKKDPLSRKISDAYKNEPRKEWGPEIVPTDEESNQLEALATEIKKDRNAPVKMVSAANKLLEALARFRAPEPPPTPQLPQALEPPPVIQPGPQPFGASPLDEAIGRFLGEPPVTVQHHQTPPPPPPSSYVPPPAPPPTVSPQDLSTQGLLSSRYPNAAPYLTTLYDLIDREANRLNPRQSAVMRIQLILDILRQERPVLAPILEKVLIDLQHI